MKIKLWHLLIIITTCIEHQSLADEIKIPIATQAPELQAVVRPKLGMSKALVKNQFGAPIKENTAKGSPPISSWEYADFLVYFENDHAIHSVLKAKQHESANIVIEEEVEMKEEDLKLK